MAHTSPITCVDHQANGTLLVTGGYDGRVVGWDGHQERWSVAFDDLVNDVRVAADGRVAVAVADRYAYVLNGATGGTVLALGPHGDDVNAVRWLPDGSGLVCVMDHLDPTIHVWRCGADGNWTASVLRGHESGVFGAAVSPDGRFLASAAEDRTARIWDLSTGEVLQVLEHPGDPEAIDWSPDGTLVATGCDDDICRLWDPTTGSLVGQLTDAKAAVRFVRFDESGARLLVGAYDATLRAYDMQTRTVQAELRAPFQWERAACAAGHMVVVGSFGGAPVFHPLTEQRDLPLTYGINSLHADPTHVLVGRDDGAVVDVLRGTVITRHQSIVNTVAREPQRGTVASADYRGTIHLSAADGTSLVAHADGGGPINSVVWMPGGERLLSAGYDGVIRRWTSDGRLEHQWVAHHSPIKSLTWCAAVGAVVAGSSDGTLSAWHDGELLWRAQADDLVLVNAVAATREGSVVVSASRDLHLRTWDAATGALIERLPRAHTKSVKAVSVSADGHTLLSGSYDGTAVLWTRPAGTGSAERTGGWQWRTLRLHGKPGVPAVALTDGGALTAGWDGTVGRWSASGANVARYDVARFR